MKKIMFIPSHFPQSEMFRAVADELLKMNSEVKIQIVDIHPQHQGIVAFGGLDNRCKVIPMLHNYSFIEQSKSINIISQLFHYSNLRKKLLVCREEIKQVLHDYNPDIIVVGHDTMMLHKIFINEASNKNIPSLLLQEGTIATSYDLNLSWTFLGKMRNYLKLLGRKARNSLFPMARQEKYGQGSVSNIAVWGEYIRRLLMSEGINPSKIVITGSPRYDKLISIKPDKRKICQQLGILPSKGIILYIDQRLIQNKLFTKKEAFIYTKSIFKAATQLQNMQLVVKLRMGQREKTSLELANNVIKDINADHIIVTDHYLYDLLACADVIISFFSTVCLEALILDKPVISVNFSGVEPYPYVKSGAVLGCYHPFKISSTIKKALFDSYTRKSLAEKRRKFVYEHLYKQDGQASKRTANVILQMAGNK